MKYDICVFGGCSLDQTFFQNVDGSYDKVPNSIAPGGKGSNQAVAASRAGARVTMISRLGKDEIGKRILDNLNINGVDTSHIEMVDGLNNDSCNIYVDINDKDNNMERITGAIDSFTPDMIENNRDVLLNSKIIVCQLKCPKEVTIALINFCYENNKTLILTPCRPDKLKISDEGNLELIDKITMITCNKKECITIFGTEDIEECVKKYPNKLIVTLGADGLIYYDGEKVIAMPAIKVDVVDTTGAGDTLNGNLSAFLVEGLDLQHALRKAMYASTMKLMKKTAQAGMPYKEDLDLFIRNMRNQDFHYSKELNYALEIVKDSYELVRYSQNIKIANKHDSTLLTESDLTIERYLISKIKDKYPKDNFVTEENYPGNTLKDRTWVIDPMDGTNHYIKKDGMWGIQLAFYDKKKTRFAVIYLPEKNELYYAGENIGAYLNNNRLFTPNIVPINQTVIEFGGSIYKSPKAKILCLKKLMDGNVLKVADVEYINACCISYTNLCTGKTDGLIISSKKPWDIMPGELICKECGIRPRYIDVNRGVRLLTNNPEITRLILPK